MKCQHGSRNCEMAGATFTPLLMAGNSSSGTMPGDCNCDRGVGFSDSYATCSCSLRARMRCLIIPAPADGLTACAVL